MGLPPNLAFASRPHVSVRSTRIPTTQSGIAIADLLLMSNVYFLPPNGSGNWPNQVWKPADNGIDLIICEPGDYTQYSDTNFGAGRYLPRQGGSDGNPVRMVYWDGSSASLDLNAIKHPSSQSSKATFDRLNLNRTGAYSANYFSFEGIHFEGQIDARANHSGFDRCYFNKADGQPVRFRTGLEGGFIRNSLIKRDSIPTTSDVVGIQLDLGYQSSPLTNVDVTGNTILNYTDAIQTTDEGEIEGCVGLTIRNNYCGSTIAPEEDGDNPLGLEQVGGVDLKVGGTVANPVVISGNYFWGNRPNSSTPGYIHTTHRYCTNVKFSNNIHANSHIGIFLNTQYNTAGNSGSGWLDPAIEFDGDIFSGIVDQGSGESFGYEPGSIIVGPNGVTMLNVKFIGCSRFSDSTVNAATSRSFTGVSVIENGETFDGTSESSGDYSISSDSVSLKTIKIPYTNETIDIVLPN